MDGSAFAGVENVARALRAAITKHAARVTGAALTHPNIARLYDAGISEMGQPYLATEYVAGTQLIESCDGRQLGDRERLRLSCR